MRTAFAIAAVLILLTACQPGSEDATANSPSQSTTMNPVEGVANQTSTMEPTIAPETHNPAARATPASPTQEVHLIEYQIHLPESVPAGRIGFNVENGGKEDHAFEIEGNGVHHQTEVLKRGDTTSVTLNLAPGTYTVYCPVDGHRGKGMEKTLVVK